MSSLCVRVPAAVPALQVIHSCLRGVDASIVIGTNAAARREAASSHVGGAGAGVVSGVAAALDPWQRRPTVQPVVGVANSAFSAQEVLRLCNPLGT
jgi:hypothetical protein